VRRHCTTKAVWGCGEPAVVRRQRSNEAADAPGQRLHIYRQGAHIFLQPPLLRRCTTPLRVYRGSTLQGTVCMTVCRKVVQKCLAAASVGLTFSDDVGGSISSSKASKHFSIASTNAPLHRSVAYISWLDLARYCVCGAVSHVCTEMPRSCFCRRDDVCIFF
jgi:hypothetical protein